MIGSVPTTTPGCLNGILQVPRWDGIKACAAGRGAAGPNFCGWPHATALTRAPDLPTLVSVVHVQIRLSLLFDLSLLSPKNSEKFFLPYPFPEPSPLFPSPENCLSFLSKLTKILDEYCINLN